VAAETGDVHTGEVTPRCPGTRQGLEARRH
jgi:hypothetical protein